MTDYGVYLCDVSWVMVEGLQVEGVSSPGFAHRCASPTDPSVGLTLRNNVITNVGIDHGVASFAGQTAPSYDLEGTVRSNDPDAGAYEH